MKVYEQVYFAQEHAAEEVQAVINRKGPIDAILAIAADYHYPGEHETRKKSSAGRGDNTYHRDGYILAVSPIGLYVGLEYVIDDGEPEDFYTLDDEEERIEDWNDGEPVEYVC